jgi:transmembrane sensor
MKPNLRNPVDTLEEQAGLWVLNQHSQDWTAAQQQALQAWLDQSEAHRREYARAFALWQQLGQFKSASFPARQAAQRQRIKHLKRRRMYQVSIRTATAASLALMLAIAINDRLSTTNYRTGIGQQQTIILADGSELNLNTDTELQVKLSNDHRKISLIRGEAYFTVAHDETRPFEVIAANGHIRDIGTRFNVYTKAENTLVTVTEGVVDIMTQQSVDPADNLKTTISDSPTIQSRWFTHKADLTRQWLPITTGANNPPIRVTAGQQVAYNDQGILSVIHSADIGQTTAWREGRLVFEMASLADVANQIARYHPVEFEFANASLKQLKVSASFDKTNLPLILSTLQATFPIKVERLDSRHIRILAVRE